MGLNALKGSLGLGISLNHGITTRSFLNYFRLYFSFSSLASNITLRSGIQFDYSDDIFVRISALVYQSFVNMTQIGGELQLCTSFYENGYVGFSIRVAQDLPVFFGSIIAKALDSSFSDEKRFQAELMVKQSLKQGLLEKWRKTSVYFVITFGQKWYMVDSLDLIQSSKRSVNKIKNHN